MQFHADHELARENMACIFIVYGVDVFELIVCRGKICGRGHETAEGDGDRICGGKEGVEGSSVNEEKGGAMALCSIHTGGSSLCFSGI